MDKVPTLNYDKQDNVTADNGDNNQANKDDDQYYKAAEDWQNEIIKLCKTLSEPSNQFNDSNTYECAKVYLIKYKRWLYSEISAYLFGISSNTTDNYIHNLEDLRKYSHMTAMRSTENTEQAKEIAYGIDKLWDHSTLAVKQNTSLRYRDEDFKKDFIKNMMPFRVQFAHEMHTQFISMIAIFTALSFIVFGGITSFANILSGMSSIPIIELVILGSVWGLCMLNLIFAFMYFVSKLTKLPIETSEKDDASLSEKYPFLVWGNFLLMLIFVVSCWMYFINYSNAHSRLVEFAQQHSLWVVFAGFLLIILIFSFFALCILLPNSRRIKSSGKSSGKKN